MGWRTPQSGRGHPAAQLRTMQRRVPEWRGIMAKELVYAGAEETYTELDGLPELALIGAGSRC